MYRYGTAEARALLRGVGGLSRLAFPCRGPYGPWIGHSGLAVLDISEAAIGHSKTRLGAEAEKVEWYVADVTEFEAPHQFGLRHDHACFTS